MCRNLVRVVCFAVVATLFAGTAGAGVSYLDPAGGWTYIYTGDLCATQFDACLDGKWHHYDAGSGGSDAWDGSAPGQVGVSPTTPSPGGAGIFKDGDTSFLRIQDCGDPRDGGWADPSNRKMTFAHNITSEVTGGTSLLNTGVTLSFRARIPTTAPLDPIYPDGGGGPQAWVTKGYNVHDDGYGAFGIKQGTTGLGIVSFSLAMDDDEGDISGNGLTMNKRVGTAINAAIDSYDAGGVENTLTGFDPTQWHEFWIQIVGDTSGGGTHKVTIWMDGDVDAPKTFHVTAGTKHEGNYDSWDGYLVMSLGRTGISGAQDVDFFGYKQGRHTPKPAREPEQAADPTPANKATDVPVGVAFGWTPGELANTHDVYLGTSFDDVDKATRDDPRGVLVSQGQTAVAYDPVLTYGQTYFWRIDEVSAAPGSEIFKGEVWRFTTEPFGLPIASVLATASSFQPDMGPENTVNGSGLNADDQHSTDAKQMWLSGGTSPAWIQFQFDKAYKLHEMWVWNYNQTVETIIGFGVKSVKVEYSLDGSTWTELAGVPEFAKGPSVDTYAHNTTVPLGVTAQYVKLTVNSTWGGMPTAGLSEVRFFYIPVQARAPMPANGATNVELDAALNWRSGREAASHAVRFGTDANAVAGGTAAAQTVAEPTFSPAGMEFGMTYFWKVEEVNEAETPSVYSGEVWSFVTREYAVVDDFEAYTDDEGSRIYETWIDGYTDDKSNSVVGYIDAPFAERQIVHGGAQSMPLEYNNVETPFFSETYREFSPAQNWAVSGADSLVLYVQGRAPGFTETSPGTILMGGGGADIWNAADQFRFAFRRLSGNGSIVAKVESVERSNEWAKVGVMIRESLDAGSKFAAVYATPDYGVRYQARLVNGIAAVSDTAVATAEQIALKTPVWVKLERTGTDYRGYYSLDGKTWTSMSWNPQAITMTGNVYIGLAVTSHSATATTTARFSNVAMTSATGAWETAEIGVAQPANAPGQLYVVVQDNAGKSKVVNHPDPAVTTSTSWQQWRIPLNEFTAAGVRVNSVKRIYVGVGDRANPVQGGAGLLYIDDIGFGRPAVK